MIRKGKMTDPYHIHYAVSRLIFLKIDYFHRTSPLRFKRRTSTDQHKRLSNYMQKNVIPYYTHLSNLQQLSAVFPLRRHLVDNRHLWLFRLILPMCGLVAERTSSL